MTREWQARYSDGVFVQLVEANAPAGAAIRFVRRELEGESDPDVEDVQVSSDGVLWTTYRVEMNADGEFSAISQRGQIAALVIRAKQELVEHHLEELRQTLGEIEELAGR